MLILSNQAGSGFALNAASIERACVGVCASVGWNFFLSKQWFAQIKSKLKWRIVDDFRWF